MEQTDPGILERLVALVHERGEFGTALEYFEKALPAWEKRGGSGNVRAARWAIARCLRSLKRYDDAMAIQRALLDEQQRTGEVDGYVFEELGEIYLARNDAAAAKPWFGKAHAVLSRDAGLQANEPARLERLRQPRHVRCTPASRQLDQET